MSTPTSAIISHHATTSLHTPTHESIALEQGIRTLMEKGSALRVESLTRETITNRLQLFMGDAPEQIEQWLDRGFPASAFERLISLGLEWVSPDQARHLSKLNQAALRANA